MMKKKWGIAVVVGAMASQLVGAAAMAKPDQDHSGAAAKSETAVEAKADSTVKENNGKAHENGQGQSVTEDTYGSKGGQGYKGLLNAIENVQDKPAGAVIAELLLSRYDHVLTAEQKAALEAIVEKDEALTATAELLEEQGEVEAAAEVQHEAVKADVTNLESYKKLGKLLNKLGKTGVKLYVNGDVPAFEVAPFIRDGSTLVPFRAISEALKADVVWNEDERSVTVTRDGITVKLFVDSTKAFVNGNEVTLEVPAAIVDGSTVVPARFISEALKATVEWDQDTQSVVIFEK
ncbi:copper amine oxidase N-terminal domain-containing protein [Paenibacillus flagellatus]|uniref:Copper amine oxidase n=1 Tax=Paenibacillus flagellatus TaxID=2211139 RepID=A0A2V5K0W6_9BACL|nr:copper amine oxidase N-terminal domain-containing protein [Paenibacillus flagellatus]PYI51113.1 copper amine oxidase [Paenibacillus flagellatus]